MRADLAGGGAGIGLLPGLVVPFIRQSDFAVRTPWGLGMRRLLDYLLVYIEEGHCVIRVNDVDYDCLPGDFCLIQPNMPHALRGLTNTITPYAHLDIFYNPRREESFPTRPFHTDLTPFSHLMQPRLNDIPGVAIPVKFRPSDPLRFRETLLRMVGVWQHRDALSQLEAQHLATSLVLSLLQDYSGLQTSQIDQPQSLNWITSYLSFHLAEPLKVEDMASRARLSPSHFRLLFRQIFGTSPHQYLLRLRVQHAQELLQGTDFSLHQIAERCGFADIHHFSKVFKRQTSTTPAAYRAQVRQAAAEP